MRASATRPSTTRPTALIAALLLAACGSTQPTAQLEPLPAAPPDSLAERPNIVVILTDDLGWYDVGFNGNPVIQTPSLDRLAAQGATLRAAYAASPVCSPSRGALLAGRFPNRIGLFDVFKNAYDMRLMDGEFTIASMLRDAGYDTFHDGKWHLSRWSQEAAAGLGFGASFAAALTPAWSLAGVANDWLENRKHPERPFFIYMATIETHHPVEHFAPPPYRAPYETRRAQAAARRIPLLGCPRNRADPAAKSTYYGAVSQLDDGVGRLVDYLDRTGLGENTFIVFTSDNGPERSLPTSYGSAGPFSGCKRLLYEGGIRMPTAVRWPRGIGPGVVIDEPIHAVDFLPTFAELSGAEVPSRYASDGVSILPALRGEKLDRKTPLYWMWLGGQSRRGGPHYYQGGMQAAIRVEDWKLLARLEPLPPNWSTMDYLRRADFDRFELYDLANDPGEQRNLAEIHPEVVERLAQELRAVHRDSMQDAPRWDLEHRRFAVQHLTDEAFVGDD